MFDNAMNATATLFKFFEHPPWIDVFHKYPSGGGLPRNNLGENILIILINKL